MRPSQILRVASLLILAAAPLQASLFSEVPGLSPSAQSSLIAHYDGRIGVATTGSTVNSWTPVDGNGASVPGMVVTSTQRGAGAADLISYDGSGSLSFDDTSVGADGRYLLGELSNAATTELSVIWLGHYADAAPFANSGTYAFNIGPNDISHQRDDGAGGFLIELYNGATFPGDDITAYDNLDAVWSTVITATTHAAWANGIDLNVVGTPTYGVRADAAIAMGAFGHSGFDLVGDIGQMIIFESALGDADRRLIEAWLGTLIETPEPVSQLEITARDGLVELAWGGDARLLSSTDMVAWFVEAGAVSPVERSIDREREFFRVVTDFTQLTEVPSGAVVRTRFASDTWREIEYHLDTGELYFIGEQAHGLDFYNAGGNDLWWCGMNSSNSGSGLLEFLMDHNLDAGPTGAAAASGGWTTYTTPNYSFLTFDPLPSQKSFVNAVAPAVAGESDTTEAYTADYTEIDSSQLLFVLYRNSSNGGVYVGIGGPSLDSLISPLPPGDGTAERDNGVRYDIAFKTTVPLSEADKLELLNRFSPVRAIYDDSSAAYLYTHPPGL